MLRKIGKNYLKDKKYCKVRDHCRYTGEYRGAVHIICNLKYSVSKQISIVFHNGSSYHYHFIIIKLAEQFKKQFTCLGENLEKCITFTVPLEKEVKKIDKMEKKLQKIYITCYSLLLAQDVWQAHYQILLIIYLKGFIELNVN